MDDEDLIKRFDELPITELSLGKAGFRRATKRWVQHPSGTAIAFRGRYRSVLRVA